MEHRSLQIGNVVVEYDSLPVRQLKIINAAPDTERLQRRDHPVILGKLLPEFFDCVVIPEYQREAMEHHKRGELIDALDPEDGIGIPDDLVLCLRTTEFTPLGAGEIIIPTRGLFLLDGHQRMSAAWVMQALSRAVLPLGAKIILN